MSNGLDQKKDLVGTEELLLSNMLEIGALIALLNREGLLLSKARVLAEIKSL